MYHLVVLEVHPVDQVVFQFVEQGRPEGGEQDHCPAGHQALQVKHGVEGATGNGYGKDAEADGVLVLEPAVPLPYIITDSDDIALNCLVCCGLAAGRCSCHGKPPFLDGDYFRQGREGKLGFARQPFDRGRQCQKKNRRQRC